MRVHASFPDVPSVLIATDADAVADEVDAALADVDTTVLRVRTGAEVAGVVSEVAPDLVVLDMQIGSMGAIAVSMQIRAEAAMGRMPSTAILLLLDRDADTFLAARAEADGWLIKPVDSFRLRRAATALLAGEDFTEWPAVETVPPVAPAEPS